MYVLLTLAILLHVAYCVLILGIAIVNSNKGFDSKLCKPTKNTTPVTIVIIARNEAHNLPQLFTSLIKQSYPNALMHIVFVDDNSSDETLATAQSYNTILNVKCINLQEYTITTHHKKHAQALAVQAATTNFIICIDADVILNTDFVSAHVQHHLVNNSSFQYGSVLFTPPTNNIISTIDYNENIALQALTRATALRNTHVLCNGTNMAFSKAAYMQLNVATTLAIAPTSGDDVLLMQQFINANCKVTYVNNSSATVTHPTTLNIKTYLQQRARWLSKQGAYTNTLLNGTMYCIGIENLLMPLYQLLMVASGIMLYIYSIHCGVLFSTLLFCIITKISVDVFLIRQYKKNSVVPPIINVTLVIATLTYSWLVWVVVVYSKFNIMQWKGRVVR
ncbi:MAG: glycosyltransferase [Bacteroidia bacterium]|nr:glycosyltransferase [Bacteroidia bacterium]